MSAYVNGTAYTPTGGVSPAKIIEATENWLEENIDPATGYAVDSSLSIEGAAADAKATGDEIADLKSAFVPLYSELTWPIKCGQYCFYNGALYYANTDISSQEDFNEYKWFETTIEKELDKINTEIAPKLGFNLLSISDFSSSQGSASINYSVLDNSVIINGANSVHSGYQTSANFLQSIITPGKKYRLSAKAEILSGSPVMYMAVRGRPGNVNAGIVRKFLSDGVLDYIDFVATEYQTTIFLSNSFESKVGTTQVKYSEIKLQEFLETDDEPFDIQYQQGTFGKLSTNPFGANVSSETRVRTKLIEFDGDTDIFVNPGYRLLLYNSSDLGVEYYTITEKANINFNHFVCRMKIIKFNDDAITPDEADANVSFYKHTNKFTIERVLKIRFAEYNIGHFAHGDSATPAGTDENLQAFRNAIFNLNADIIAIAENDPYFKSDKSLTSYDALYNIYPYYKSGSKNTAQCNAIVSKWAIGNTRQIDFTNRHQQTYMLDNELNIEGRLIHIIVTHLDWWDVDIRRSQIAQIIEHCSAYEYCIIAGDMNPGGRVNGVWPDPPGTPFGVYEDDYAYFTEAGYKMANTGYFGTFTTDVLIDWPDGIKPIDNIFVKAPKGFITYVEMQTPPVSDHYPLIADILLL